MVLNFFIVQAAPGGPVEQMIAQIQGTGATPPTASPAAARRRADPAAAERRAVRQPIAARAACRPSSSSASSSMYGFDKPIYERFWIMMQELRRVRLRRELLPQPPVVDLVIDKMPVSISLGLWTTLLIYLISIPLGIAKAVRDGSRFDVAVLERADRAATPSRASCSPSCWSCCSPAAASCNGSRCAASSRTTGRASASADKILDYLWHMVLPIAAMVIGGFAGLTMLTKNSFLEEIGKQYVLTARAKGLVETPRALRPRLPQRHADRDRRLPGRLHRACCSRGSLLIEMIFSLDGLGLLGFEAAIEPRLSGDVRHALRLRPDRPGDEHRRRPHLHRGRSAHRLRGAAADATRHQPAPARPVPRQQARHDLAACVFGAAVPRSRCSPSSSPTTGRS